MATILRHGHLSCLSCDGARATNRKNSRTFWLDFSQSLPDIKCAGSARRRAHTANAAGRLVSDASDISTLSAADAAMHVCAAMNGGIHLRELNQGTTAKCCARGLYARAVRQELQWRWPGS
jgi:hypothetical protein